MFDGEHDYAAALTVKRALRVSSYEPFGPWKEYVGAPDWLWEGAEPVGVETLAAALASPDVLHESSLFVGRHVSVVFEQDEEKDTHGQDDGEATRSKEQWTVSLVLEMPDWRYPTVLAARRVIDEAQIRLGRIASEVAAQAANERCDDMKLAKERVEAGEVQRGNHTPVPVVRPGTFLDEPLSETVWIRPPEGLAKQLAPQVAGRAALRLDARASVEVIDGGVRIEREGQGLLDEIASWLQREEQPVATSSREVDPSHMWYWVPIALAGLMLVSWSVPLERDTWWALLITTAIIGVLVVILGGRYVQTRDVYTHYRLVPAFWMTGIAAFGIAYATCRLAQPGSAEGLETIGHAFFISTGLGVSGGFLDVSLSGVARVVAHVELLLFAATVTAAVVGAFGGFRHVREIMASLDERVPPREHS